MNDKTQIKRTFLEDCYIASYPTKPEHDNVRLDQFLMSYLPTFSREFIKKKIAAKEIVILGRDRNKGKLRPSTKVKYGDRVEMYCYRSDVEDEYWHGEKIEFDPVRIIEQDDNLIIISKPAFMSTHPAGKHLFNCANVYLEQKLGHPVMSVHRLDRETSGVLVMTKNSHTANDLTRAFERHDVKKCYLLIAHKKQQTTSFPFQANERLDNARHRQFMEAFPADSTRGKHAITDFELIEENENYIIALAYPKTGRQHQIRIHAAYHGHPLIGDKLYHGGFDLFGRFKDGVASDEDHALMQIPRHALHALGIIFPYQGKMKLIIDTIPNDLKTLISNNFQHVNFEEIQHKIDQKISNYFKDLRN